MARIQPLNPYNTTGAIATTLDMVKTEIGTVPNLFATFAQSFSRADRLPRLSCDYSSGRAISGRDLLGSRA